MTNIIIDAGPAPDQSWSDAARRCADAVNLHVTVDPVHSIGKWVAVALADGRSDGVLYDKKADAVRHQLHETMCAYVCIPPGGMPTSEAEVYLKAMRQLYDAGYRLADPDRHVVMKDARGLIRP
jgi:hypothetical protein